MTGSRHGAATRSHVPGAECCLQPINQQGRLPGLYPSNPLHPPARLPDLPLSTFYTDFIVFKKRKKKKRGLQLERDNESRLDDSVWVFFYFFLLDNILVKVSVLQRFVCAFLVDLH